MEHEFSIHGLIRNNNMHMTKPIRVYFYFENGAQIISTIFVNVQNDNE